MRHPYLLFFGILFVVFGYLFVFSLCAVAGRSTREMEAMGIESVSPPELDSGDDDRRPGLLAVAVAFAVFWGLVAIGEIALLAGSARATALSIVDWLRVELRHGRLS